MLDESKGLIMELRTGNHDSELIEVIIPHERWDMPNKVIMQFVKDCRKIKSLHDDTIIRILDLCDDMKCDPYIFLNDKKLMTMMEESRIAW